jgi:hypothetical protein
MPRGKAQELWEELKSVFSGRGVKLLDAVLPVVIFLAANSRLGIPIALGLSFGAAVLVSVFRLIKKDNLGYALGGVGAVLLAAAFAFISNSAVGFFLPGLITSGLTVILLLASAVVRRPLAAVTSHLTRSWPLAWYWHPQVRPAYSEVTIFWAVGFGARLGLEYWLFQQGAAGSLGLIRTVLGWPYTILLLIISYLYGLWRLGKLSGPSVEEFQSGENAPWEGQKRGF